MYEGGKDSLYKNILIAAATSGNKDTWEAVIAELERNEVERSPTPNENYRWLPQRHFLFRRLAVGLLAGD